MEKITPFTIKEIYCINDIEAMIKELLEKNKKDKEILDRFNSEENLKVYKGNLYILNWLKFDFYSTKSLTSKINDEDISNGWFIWLKDYEIEPHIKFDTIDEKNTYMYSKYFKYFYPALYEKNAYLDEAIFCFEQEKYHACACLLFTCIENTERSITEFNPSEMFVMSKAIAKTQSLKVPTFNDKYFHSFEEKMNNFLKENFYLRSMAADAEPSIINRNRIMHGIFTRKISKTDCLKLFTLENSLLQFNDWLESYRKMKELSNEL